MIDLQNALNDYDQHQGDSLRSDNLKTIVEAARLVANPDYQAAYDSLFAIDPTLEAVTEAVDAALGVDTP